MLTPHRAARKLVLSLLVLLGFAWPGWMHAREERLLHDQWRFILRDAPLTESSADWTSVQIPHTWNNLDGQDGPTPGHTARAEERGSDYFRGVGWYEHTLAADKAWQGQRVFVRFEAVSQAATVYLNGVKLGTHLGAFTGFAFELTAQLRFDRPNILRVQADNSRNLKIVPLAGDFNVDGGIYRPVHLLITDSVCISPLELGSSGVAVEQIDQDADAVTLAVTTSVNSRAQPVHGLEINCTLLDAAGQVAGSGRQEIANAAGAEPNTVKQTLKIRYPHLWAGRRDPYLYTLVVALTRDAKTVDRVSQTVGLRTVAVTSEGFQLNGHPYPIFGVNRHQDLRDHGWALTPADEERDVQMIAEIGATAVRVAHYPQSENFYSLCDRAGILIWNEVPFVNDVPSEKEAVDAPSPQTEEFNRNLENILREMIAQRRNHPAVAFWGLYNELRPSASRFALAEVRRLNSLVHQLDRTRPTVAASDHIGNPTNFVPDQMAYNVYPGWYFGTGAMGELAGKIDTFSAERKNTRVGLSEYGAGGNPAQHSEELLHKPDANHGAVHPEEWQSLMHERDWAQIVNNPKLWGSFVWAMFDFASDGRDEGGQHGINDKGLVTQDRQLRKDAFYFYQANWSAAPMLHIASSRATVRHQAATEVKVYSNSPEVELMVNDRSLGIAQPDALHMARWTITLAPGRNTIRARTSPAGPPLVDECQWDLVPEATSSPRS